MFNMTKILDKAIKALDVGKIEVKYDDALGDTHTFLKNSVEEAKKVD